MSKIPHRLYLTEDQMPQKWFNLRSAMAEQPDPLLHPGTLRPLGVDDLSPIFCEELARQELDGATAYVDIPEPIQNVYKMYRPSPLIRAYELEKALDTPARIYYKFEGNNTSLFWTRAQKDNVRRRLARQIFHSISTFSLVARITVISASTTCRLSSKLTFSQSSR